MQYRKNSMHGSFAEPSSRGGRGRGHDDRERGGYRGRGGGRGTRGSAPYAGRGGAEYRPREEGAQLQSQPKISKPTDEAGDASEGAQYSQEHEGRLRGQSEKQLSYQPKYRVKGEQPVDDLRDQHDGQLGSRDDAGHDGRNQAPPNQPGSYQSGYNERSGQEELPAQQRSHGLADGENPSNSQNSYHYSQNTAGRGYRPGANFAREEHRKVAEDQNQMSG